MNEHLVVIIILAGLIIVAASIHTSYQMGYDHGIVDRQSPRYGVSVDGGNNGIESQNCTTVINYLIRRHEVLGKSCWENETWVLDN